MQFVKPMPFVDAAEKLGGKSVIGSKLLSREWADVPVGLRERAFWSATVENVRFLQRGRDAIGEFLLGTREKVVSPTGKESMALATGSRADFVKQMQAFLEAEGVVRTTGGIKDIASERRLGLIFDTNARAAQDYGAWKQGQDPDVLDAFPAQRFIRVVEVTTARDEHEDEEGQVRLKSDLEFWRSINRDFGVPWGPWGWGCGHDVEDVSRDEAEVLGLLKPGEAVRPVEQEFNEALKASVTNLDPDLQGLLKEQFGDQVEIENGTAKWVGQRQESPAVIEDARPEPLPTGMAGGEVREAPARLNPVSASVQADVGGNLKRFVDGAVAAIDRVHDDGKLPVVKVVRLMGRENGCARFRRDLSGGKELLKLKEVAVRATGKWPRLTTAHEIAHVLDVEAIGTRGEFASKGGELREVLAAARKTKGVAALEGQAATAPAKTKKWIRGYLLSDEELWARAYAQFVAEKSGSAEMARELDIARQESGYPGYQWEKSDFAPVAAAIEALFKKLRWI